MIKYPLKNFEALKWFMKGNIIHWLILVILPMDICITPCLTVLLITKYNFKKTCSLLFLTSICPHGSKVSVFAVSTHHECCVPWGVPSVDLRSCELCHTTCGRSCCRLPAPSFWRPPSDEADTLAWGGPDVPVTHNTVSTNTFNDVLHFKLCRLLKSLSTLCMCVHTSCTNRHTFRIQK